VRDLERSIIFGSVGVFEGILWRLARDCNC